MLRGVASGAFEPVGDVLDGVLGFGGSRAMRQWIRDHSERWIPKLSFRHRSGRHRRRGGFFGLDAQGETDVAIEIAPAQGGIVAIREAKSGTLLLVLEVERRASAAGPVDIVRRLEAIKAYPVIAALEQLYARPDPNTREAVAAAMGNLRFKRSFGLIGRALRDEVHAVREAAATARLSDFLCLRASSDLRRAVVLRSVARVG